MTKIYNNQLLALMCFILSVGMIASCKKDNNVNSGKIELLSFGPTGARHGDTLRFIGNNLNKVTAIQFTGGAAATIEQTNFKTQTSELIQVIVPAAAEKGYVTLKTPEGDIVTKTQLDLKVLAIVASFNAQARPGENITITGNYLNWVTRVTFARDKAVETFVSKTLTQIVVKVPDDAETGPLILFYGGTLADKLQTSDTLKVALPVAVSFAPNPVKPLTNLTITGTNLDLAKKIIFTGVSTPVTTFVSQSATQLVVNVPATAKKGKLTLEALSAVQTISAADLDIVLPVSSTLSPNPINLGTNLTITGTNLDLVKKVIFTGVAPAVTTFVSQTVTQLVVTVPAGSRDGKVTLEAASGVQTQSAASIDVLLPSVTNMSPNPVFPATNLTITGTMLNVINSITFSNAPAVTSFVSQSATQIVVTVPNGVLNGELTLGFPSPADTIHSGTILAISGGVPPPTIAFPFYDEGVTSNWTSSGWIGGGWGGTVDYNNTSPVRVGTKSAKISYVGGWGSPLQLGGASISLSPYTTFKISIYGGTGTAGQKVNIGINGADAYTITLVEGQWTDYAIPISGMTSATTLSEIIIKEYNGSGGFTIYVDAMGLN